MCVCKYVASFPNLLTQVTLNTNSNGKYAIKQKWPISDESGCWYKYAWL